MRTTKKILSLLLLSLVFVACGKDNEPDPVGPTPVPVQKEINFTYIDTIKGIKDAETIRTLRTLNLKDILTLEPGQEFVSAELQRGKSYIGVFNLNKLTPIRTLENFTITVGSNEPKNFGNCTPNPLVNGFLSDIELSTDKETDYIKTMLDKISSTKKLELKLSLTPRGGNVLETDTVLLKIKISAIYTYNTYPAK